MAAASGPSPAPSPHHGSLCTPVFEVSVLELKLRAEPRFCLFGSSLHLMLMRSGSQQGVVNQSKRGGRWLQGHCFLVSKRLFL